jgi:hypothetical protein
MRQYLPRAIVIAVLASLTAGAGLRVTRTNAADSPRADEVWSTKKVMDKLYVGKQSLAAVLFRDIRKDEPDWQTDEKNLAEMIRLMSMLTKQKPPRGSQEAWDKLVRDYVDTAEVMRQNVRERRLQPARASMEKLGAACDECHDNHGIK